MSNILNIKDVEEQIRKVAAGKLQLLTKGLQMAGLKVQRESKSIVPVDYGHLKASCFTRSENEGTRKIRVTVGYTAAYAVFVHENLDALHGAQFNAYYAKELAAARRRRKKGQSPKGPFRHNRGAAQQAKFLEQPFRALRSSLLTFVGMVVRT